MAARNYPLLWREISYCSWIIPALAHNNVTGDLPLTSGGRKIGAIHGTQYVSLLLADPAKSRAASILRFIAQVTHLREAECDLGKGCHLGMFLPIGGHLTDVTVPFATVDLC